MGFFLRSLQVCFDRARSLPVSSVWVSAGSGLGRVGSAIMVYFGDEATVQVLGSGETGGSKTLAENSWIGLL